MGCDSDEKLDRQLRSASNLSTTISIPLILAAWVGALGIWTRDMWLGMSPGWAAVSTALLWGINLFVFAVICSGLTRMGKKDSTND